MRRRGLKSTSHCTRTLLQQQPRHRLQSARVQPAHSQHIRNRPHKCKVVHLSHITRHTSHVTRHTSHVTRHTSHMTSVAGHCCVACLQSAGSHGPACQQVVWHRPSSQSASTTSTPAAPAAASRAQTLAAPLQPRGAGGSEVELVLECAAALRAGAAGEANTLQVIVALAQPLLGDHVSFSACVVVSQQLRSPCSSSNSCSNEVAVFLC